MLILLKCTKIINNWEKERFPWGLRKENVNAHPIGGVKCNTSSRCGATQRGVYLLQLITCDY